MFQSLTISKRLYIGFGIIIIGMMMAFISTFYTISNSKKVNDAINNEINPSVATLNALANTLQNLVTYTGGWFNAVGPNDNKRDPQLKYILNQSYPNLKVELQMHAKHWSPSQTQLIHEVLINADSLIVLSKLIFKSFETIEDYDDELKKISFTPWFDENGEIGTLNKLVTAKLKILIDLKREEANQKSEEMKSAFNRLIRFISIVGMVLFVGAIVISFFTVRAIVDPIEKLKVLINTLSTGQIPQQSLPKRQDEIGEMSSAIDNLINGFERTTVFANEIGQGQFETNYQPLSQKDTLGQALLEMRNEIKDSRRSLEVKVEERTLELKQQKEQIEYLYQQVTSSIVYAKRIQESILPNYEKVKAVLPNSFILYQPKAIVSGDFYWIEVKNNKTYIAAVDCTGHGVPGAFMSLLGRNLLNLVLNEFENPSPAEILNGLNAGISEALYSKDLNAKDGMDIAICCLDYNREIIEFAGAINELYLIRNKELQIIAGDKHYIGMAFSNLKGYSNHSIKLEVGDSIYIFTDGYRDQFGEVTRKKFMRKRFNQMLLEHCHLDMQAQHKVYQDVLKQWMGSGEQTDDVLLMGWKI